MYNEGGGAAIGGGGAVSAGGLAVTGFSVMGFAILAFALLLTGVLLLRLATVKRHAAGPMVSDAFDPAAALAAAVAATSSEDR